MRSETGALVLSAAAALTLAGLGLTAAFLSNSRAILLDGLYNLVFFVTALVTLRIARLLRHPDDEKFPFGYMYFEPLINTVKGLLILGVSLFALVDAVTALMRGGRALVLGPALVYAAAATCICVAVYWLLRRAGRHLRSPLIDADIGNWLVNAAISGGVFVAFGLALLLERAGMRVAAAHVDPALVSVVVVFSLGVPIRMAAQGLMALLNRAPPAPLVAAIAAAVRGALSPLDCRKIYVRVVKPGRTTYVVVHVLVAEDAGLDVSRADELRRSIVAALAADHTPIIADVVFTAVDEFAAPTTGFVAQPGGA